MSPPQSNHRTCEPENLQPPTFPLSQKLKYCWAHEHMAQQESNDVPGFLRKVLVVSYAHITSARPATTANSMSSEIAVILAASLLGMTASVYIHKTPRCYCGFPSRQDRKGENACVKPFGEGFGSALQEPVITSQTGRMEFLMRMRGSLMILMIFIPIC